MHPRDAVMTEPSRLRAAFSGWNLSWSSTRSNGQGEWWFLGQMALIVAVILVPAWPDPGLFKLPAAGHQALMAMGSLLLVSGLGLATAAFVQLGANLSPLPDPKPGIQLVGSGVYRLCRHPIYLAVLLCATGVTIQRFSVLHLVLLLALAWLLRGKARREEEGLQRRHPQYAQMFQTTAAIAPWIVGLNWSVEEAKRNQHI